MEINSIITKNGQKFIFLNSLKEIISIYESVKETKEYPYILLIEYEDGTNCIIESRTVETEYSTKGIRTFILNSEKGVVYIYMENVVLLITILIKSMMKKLTA